jgi:hypothetical protein
MLVFGDLNKEALGEYFFTRISIPTNDEGYKRLLELLLERNMSDLACLRI